MKLSAKSYIKYLLALRKRNKAKKIVIVCMPKTGSTYLYKKLERYTHFPRITLRSHHEVQELDPVKIYYFKNFDLIDQIHVDGSQYTVNQLNFFNARVIILYRNLFDLALSMADFLDSKEYQRELQREGYAMTYGGCIDGNFSNLSRSEKIDRVIYFDLPAYVRFFVSWKNYAVKLNNAPLWLSYDEFFADKERHFKRILEHCYIDVDDEQVSETLASEDKTRFNKGQSRGRDETELSADHIRKIEEILKYHPQYAPELLKMKEIGVH